MSRALLPALIALSVSSGTAWGAMHDGRALLLDKCAACHDEDSRAPIPFRDEPALAARLKAPSSSNPARALKSELLLRLRSTDPETRMPQDQPPLPADAVAAIERYLDGLARRN